MILFLIRIFSFVALFAFSTVCLGAPARFVNVADLCLFALGRTSLAWSFACFASADVGYVPISHLFIATGLYYLAEVMEEYERTAKRVLRYSIFVRYSFC